MFTESKAEVRLSPASREELCLMDRVARMYYMEHLCQPDIALRLGMTRSRVSRLLSKGEEENVVRINISTPPDVFPDLEDALRTRSGLMLTLVTDAASDSDEDVLPRLCTAAAYCLETTLRLDHVVGIMSWSSKHFQPRLGGGSGFPISWPVLRNKSAWQGSPLHFFATTWLDPTRAPLKSQAASLAHASKRNV